MSSFIVNIAFLSIEVIFIILVVLVILQTGVTRLESKVGVARDGFPPGKKIPSWQLPDITGQMQQTPTGDHWQLLLFADHVLGGFLDVVGEMNHLALSTQDLDIVILSQRNKALCEAMVRGLNLHVPVVSVNEDFYRRFRVRVMPFGFLLDQDGTVQWVGVINSKAWLTYVWQLAKKKASIDSSLEEVRK